MRRMILLAVLLALAVGCSADLPARVGKTIASHTIPRGLTMSGTPYTCTYEQIAPAPGIGATCQLYSAIDAANPRQCRFQTDFAPSAYGQGTDVNPPAIKLLDGYATCAHQCDAWAGRIVVCQETQKTYRRWPSFAIDHQDCLATKCQYLTTVPGG